MTYVISDLHGYPLEKLIQLLDKAKFSDDDFLYILGDVIDRNGDGGIKMLQWLMAQPNIQLILGNHEAMLLSCKFVFDEITDDTLQAFSSEKMELLSNYIFNGGDVTLNSLKTLSKASPDAVFDILDYLGEAPFYEAVTVADKDFILVHSGLGNFGKNKKLCDYTSTELLWTRPSLTEQYFDSIVTVFGHTPTLTYGAEHKGKIIKTDSWINIDMGVSCGEKPVLLRLDDFEEYRL